MKFDICNFLEKHSFPCSPVSCSNNGARADEQAQDGRLVFNRLISLFILYFSDDGAV